MMQLNLFASQMNLFEAATPPKSDGRLTLMDGTAANKHGVFESGYKTLMMPHPKMVWGYIEIDYAQLSNGQWIFDAGYNTGTQSRSGPLMFDDPNQFPTKQACLLAALDGLNKRLWFLLEERSEPNEKKILKKMLQWVANQRGAIANGEEPTHV